MLFFLARKAPPLMSCSDSKTNYQKKDVPPCCQPVISLYYCCAVTCLSLPRGHAHTSTQPMVNICPRKFPCIVSGKYPRKFSKDTQPSTAWCIPGIFPVNIPGNFPVSFCFFLPPLRMLFNESPLPCMSTFQGTALPLFDSIKAFRFLFRRRVCHPSG